MIKAIWTNNAAQIIEDIVETLEEDCQDETKDNITSFLDSVFITRLKFKTKGDIEVPRFNVYADGQLIPNDDVWFYLRETLASLPYTSPMLGRGQTVIAPSTCQICHGVDHPTGMCKFPEIKGWNGPTRESIANSSLQNGDRFYRGTRNLRQSKF
jgi:hypothetical protein